MTATPIADADGTGLDVETGATTVVLDSATIAITGQDLNIRCVDREKPVGSKKGPRYKQKLVVERHAASGRLRHNEYVTDRRHPDKAERLSVHRAWDFETGELVYESVDPLSLHVGHGSAKRRDGE